MATTFNYVISTDTANGKIAPGKLHDEISASNITIAIDSVNTSGDSLTVIFKTDISSQEETTLTSLISTHDGIPGANDPESVIIESQQPFAAKTLTSGKKLYAREQGVAGVTISAGATGSIVFEVPYLEAKISGAQILGCQLGDTVNFKVQDTSTGTLTGVPYYTLNQFGYNVNMPSGQYEKTYNYDADLFQGLNVCAEYTNNGSNSITVYVNIDIHEVKS